jgi:LysM repeat protein
MTRETKIGLLVGLCFLIVIGILLSEAFHTNDQPPAANLAIAGTTVRAGNNSFDSGHPAVTFVQPADIQPRQSVPVHEDFIPPHSPVSLGSSPTSRTPSNQTGSQPAASNNTQTVTTLDSAPGTSQSQSNPLFKAAHQNGTDLVVIGPDGRQVPDDSNVIVTNLTDSRTPTPSPTQTNRTPPTPAPIAPAVAANRSYVAVSGDSVSKMAARFLGSSTKTTRNLIIQANPSLQQNPDMVVAGQTYIIPAAPAAAAGSATPGAAPAAAATIQASAPTPAAVPTPPAAASAAGATYVVQAGDNLWKIARDQVGDPHQVDAIKQLNADVLRGDNHDVVVPGMKLSLPSRAVASAH